MRQRILFGVLLLLTAVPNEASFLDQYGSSLGQLAKGLLHTFAGVTEQGGQVVGDLVGQAVSGAGSLVSTGVSTFVDSLTDGSTGRRDLSGFLSLELEKLTQQIIEEKKSGLKAVTDAALTKLKQLAGSFGNIEFLKQPMNKFVDRIDDIIASHHVLNDAILEDIVQQIKKTVITKLGKLVTDEHIKDQILDHIDAEAKEILTPHINLIKQTVTTIGLSLKATATKLTTAIQKHMSTPNTNENIDEVMADLHKVLIDGQNLIRTSGQKVITAMSDKVKSLHGQN